MRSARPEDAIAHSHLRFATATDARHLAEYVATLCANREQLLEIGVVARTKAVAWRNSAYCCRLAEIAQVVIDNRSKPDL